MNFTKKYIDRFWNKIEIKDSDQCWNWQFGKNKDGYGKYFADGVHITAHKFSYLINNGNIPNAMLIRHTCDNPCCCNPKHLILGTDQDNTNDRISRNRSIINRGENHGMSILNKSQIIEIRNRYSNGEGSYKQFAREYGVRKSTIGHIIRNETWRNLNE